MPTINATLEQIRDDYDWREVFKYAGTPAGEYGDPAQLPTAVPGYTGSTDAFGPDDVAEVIASDNGENDGPDWIAVFRLNDGRFAALQAGCDYTGWG
jgi:hypothetical protein